jgi:heme/copper-type cytochrome/quinol oxidase subunit 4
MDPSDADLWMTLGFLFVIFLTACIIAGVFRWVFRINTIVKMLGEIKTILAEKK